MLLSTNEQTHDCERWGEISPGGHLERKSHNHCITWFCGVTQRSSCLSGRGESDGMTGNWWCVSAAQQVCVGRDSDQEGSSCYKWIDV